MGWLHTRKGQPFTEYYLLWLGTFVRRGYLSSLYREILIYL
jgi:hypothetical protein